MASAEKTGLPAPGPRGVEPEIERPEPVVAEQNGLFPFSDAQRRCGGITDAGAVDALIVSSGAKNHFPSSCVQTSRYV